MSISTHVVAFRPADERWQSMKAIYDVCCKADVTIPEEVLDFFDNEPPDEAGVEVDIDEAVRGWSDDSREGFEVDLTKLPYGVKILRFYNSY